MVRHLSAEDKPAQGRTVAHIMCNSFVEHSAFGIALRITTIIRGRDKHNQLHRLFSKSTEGAVALQSDAEN
jgi:hypothetical protein